MHDHGNDARERMSLAVALLIAACVIGLFCALSIAIARSIESDGDPQVQYFALKPTKNYLTEHPFL